MKKLSIFLFLTLFVTGVFGQNYVEVKNTQLPKKIIEFFKKDHAYTMGRAAKLNNKGIISYAVVGELRGNKLIYVFDKDGKFLRKEKNLKAIGITNPGTPGTPAGKNTGEKSK